MTTAGLEVPMTLPIVEAVCGGWLYPDWKTYGEAREYSL
jgi:hypothetical protein